MILTNVQRFARRVSLRSFGGALLLVTLVLSAAGCGPTLNSLPSGSGDISSGSAQWPASGGLPRPDHIVIVVEENHSFEQIVGSASAPYINSLAASGALFTNAHAVEHPSQPNYLDLFSGSNQGVTSDACPQSFSTPNLASELISKGLTFGGYAEDLPDTGS